MGLYRVVQPLDVHLPTMSLKGWQFAIAMGAAIVLAPVVGLILLLVVGTMIPVLPLLATLFVSLWLMGRH